MIHHHPFQVEAPKCLSEAKTFPDFDGFACMSACRGFSSPSANPKVFSTETRSVPGDRWQWEIHVH